MKDFSTRNEVLSRESRALPSYLTSRPNQGNQLLFWWYRLASPPVPGSSASFHETESFRRGRTGSQLILALFFLLIISIPAGFVGTNIYLIPIVIGSCIALIAATILNRLGIVTPAGIIVLLTFMAFPYINIATTPGGLNMMVLPLFGLLVLPLLCAVSFLPPIWVFAVAFCNCIFTLISLVYLPHTAELDAILVIAYAGIVTPIILSQVLVSVVAYAWVQGTSRALVRADRAEELARLEHDLALQAESGAHDKQRLEASIQKIVETHMRVANGDFNARVPLTDDNVLWQISGPLNNLVARMQSLRQEVIQVQQLKYALQQAHEENRRLRLERGLL